MKASSNFVYDVGLFAARAGTGAMLFLFHGRQKLVSAFADVHGQQWRFIQTVDQLGLPWPKFFAFCSAAAEGVGSLLLIFGLFTRYAAGFVVINMAVAIYRHLTGDWKFELAALYGLIALVFVLIHPGRFSIDAHVGRRRLS